MFALITAFCIIVLTTATEMDENIMAINVAADDNEYDSRSQSGE